MKNFERPNAMDVHKQHPNGVIAPKNLSSRPVKPQLVIITYLRENWVYNPTRRALNSFYYITYQTNSASCQELIVDIRQRPNLDAGFGFRLEKNGKNSLQISDLLKGGSADKSSLALGDEILEINGRPVCQAPLEIVEKMLKEAVKLGKIELRMRRALST